MALITTSRMAPAHQLLRLRATAIGGMPLLAVFSPVHELPDGAVPPRRQRLGRVMTGTGLHFLLAGLGTAGFPLSSEFATLFGLVSLIGVWRSVGHRGVGGRLCGLGVVDERESRTASDALAEQLPAGR